MRQKKEPNKTEDRLTNRQEAFAQAYVRTRSQTKAYREAYDTAKMKPETVTRRAYDVFHNGKVKARIEQLQNIARANEDGSAIMTARELYQLLADIARGEAEIDTTDMFGNPKKRPPTGNERLKAIAELIKLGVAEKDDRTLAIVFGSEAGSEEWAK
ncbi:MAG: terminase small subunit [Oscillospiraceae bacterium]|nr:terminase small subunit [Oscillospiraceae bacterium]MBQ9960085.1 terminase small subunit [Oscillospiraceae bacterium]